MGLLRKGFEIYRQKGAQRLVDEGLGKFLPHSVYNEQKANLEFKRRESPTVTNRDGGHSHIILIVIDALREDVINSKNAPHLDKFQNTTGITAAPWTYPSVTSILTGLYPHEHGAMRQDDDPHNTGVGKIGLPPKSSHTTLPEYFDSAGYETYGAFGFEMPFLALSGRFKKHKLYDNCDAETLISDFKTWIDKNMDKNTFSYLHFSDLHQPTNPPSKYWKKYNVNEDIDDIVNWGGYTDEWSGKQAEKFQENKKQLYRASLNYVDEQIESLLKHIKAKYSNPEIIITSDHGEAFWEWAEFDAEHFYDSRPAYCVGHGGTPYESISKIPIMYENVQFSSGLCSTIDITPTLLSVNNIQTKEDLTGLSQSDRYPTDRKLLIESASYGYEKKAIYESDFKLLRSRGDKETIAFKIPEETILKKPSAKVQELEDEFPAWPKGGAIREVNQNVQNRLENLGYQ